MILKNIVFYVIAGFFLFASAAWADFTKQQKDFIYFVSFGRVEDVKLLVDKGADPNQKDEQGWSMLSIAASRSDAEALDVVKVLVEAGADVNAADDQKNYPLMRAIQNNSPPIVDYLINKGADFHIKTKDGITAHEMSKRTGNKKIIDIIGSLVNAEIELDKQRRDPNNKLRLIKEYLYYNCTFQYLTDNISTHLYLDKKDEAAAKEKLKLQQHKATLAMQDLYSYFQVSPKQYEKSAQGIRNKLSSDLYEMVSNRNRRAHGVGKDEDMNTRCEAMAETYLKQALSTKKR